MNYSEIEAILDYHFQDPSRLDIAFTHKSYANEHPSSQSSYERYEFLGDAILEMISSEVLFTQFPEKSEGQLTRLRASLVCEYTLSEITRNLGFGKYLYLSHGEELTGGRERSSILCDLFESVLGAIYLDGGWEPARKYVNRFLLSDMEKHIMFHDAKSILQEYSQAHSLRLEYKVIGEKGPEHNREYEVALFLEGRDMAHGKGRNKKMAEQIAAHQTMLLLNMKPE